MATIFISQVTRPLQVMPEIGEQLAAERQRRAWTIGDVARRLQIRAMFVDAIERENWKVVGEPVYVRGFVRNYARLVRLDPRPMLVELDRRYPLPKPSAESLAPLAEPPARRFSWLLWSMSAVAAVLVALVVWNWILLQRGPVPQIATSSTAMVPAQRVPTQSTNAVASKISATQSGVNLQLQLTQASWLAVTVDGKRVVYETLPAGSVREFHAAREITLRAGNAGGVNATIDGQNLGTLGVPGEVSDRIFAAKTLAPPSGPRE